MAGSRCTAGNSDTAIRGLTMLQGGRSRTTRSHHLVLMRMPQTRYAAFLDCGYAPTAGPLRRHDIVDTRYLPNRSAFGGAPARAPL
jgi:hypothetical protein